jgi:MraZ protein
VVLRGNYSVKIDEKGRLKIPALFRTAMQDRYGTQVYVTSRKDKGVVVNIYPMPVWEEMERKLADLPPSLPELARYVDLVNYYGQPGEIDKQGRVSIHPLLRESAAMAGDVDVLGQLDHLDIWNHERFSTRMANEPFTDADARKLSEFGI